MTQTQEIPSRMKAIRLHTDDPSSLIYEELDTPQPGRDEVLVRVHAAAITRDELAWPVDRLPAIPSYELSGVIAAVGADVDPDEISRDIYALTPFDRDGSAAEYVAVATAIVADKPQNLTHVEAASVPLPALTVMQGLFDHANLEKGERVLIHGASGGVGAYAVQIAKQAGARVIATTSTSTVDLVSSLGADQVLDHTQTRFEETVGTVDVVFDTSGGEKLDRSVAVLEKSGRLIAVADEPPYDRCAEKGIFAHYFVVEPNGKELDQVTTMLEEGKLRPIVDTVYPLANAQAAFKRTVDRESRGKIVLEVLTDSGA